MAKGLWRLAIQVSKHRFYNRTGASEQTAQLAPIMFMDTRQNESVSPVSPNDVPSGTTLLFPNGLRAHFGRGAENILMEILQKSLSSHVLP